MKNILYLIFLIFKVDVHGLTVEAMVGNSLYLPDFKPQIVMKCGYYNQYLDRTGIWLSDSNGICTDNNTAITEYCRNIYPNLNITNIMPMGKTIKVDNWCAPDQLKCDKVFDVYPIRCLEGKFQSEALLVPEGCVFDHVHSSKLCKGQDYWKAKAAQACAIKFNNVNKMPRRNRVPIVDVAALNSKSPLRSYSMLLPCDIGAFSGVEFVCCANKNGESQGEDIKIPNNVVKGSKEDGDDYVVEDNRTKQKGEIADNNVNNVNKIAISQNEPSYHSLRAQTIILATPPTVTYPTSSRRTPINQAPTGSTHLHKSTESSETEFTQETTGVTDDGMEKEQGGIKTYYSAFDKDKEHERFVGVKNWMKEKRRKTIINLMRDWTLSEKRYNDIKAKDPYLAQRYKQDISKSFQKTISALEAEEKAQKKQLTAIHEQRVTSLLNTKKRKFMFEFLKELEKPYPSPDHLKIALERLLRAEERDKMHVIHYYEHLLNSDPEAAARVKRVVARHIMDVERRFNRSLAMLKRRLPTSSYDKIAPHIASFLETIKTRNGDFAELTNSIVQDESDKIQASILSEISTSSPGSNTTTKSLNLKLSPQKSDDSPYDDSEDDADDSYDNDDDDDDDDETVDNEVVNNKIQKKVATSTTIGESQMTATASTGSPILYAKRNDDQLFHYGDSKNLPFYSSGLTSIKNSNRHSTAYLTTVTILTLSAFAAILLGAVMIKRRFTTIKRSKHAPVPTCEEDCDGKEGNGTNGKAKAGMFKKKIFKDNVSDYVEVDNRSLEERNLASMQVNGYENPTYKYFEKIASKP